MRTEAEIIKQVLDVAVDDPAVRAVIRTNLLPQRDYLHLYEFFFVVSDVEKYENDIFKDSFGERILLYRGDNVPQYKSTSYGI